MDVENGQGAARSIVTIGAYDGVHAGHRQLIGEVLRVAAERGLHSVAVTFDRHPATVVRPQSAPKLITDLDQKLDLLRGAGLDEVVVIPFDAERASESAEEFVNEILVGRLDAAVVIVGRDFHFGNARRGNVQLLQAMGGELGFEVVGFSLLTTGAGGEAVSSTRIRALIEAGDVEGAAELLGRAHEVRGQVESASPHDGGDASPHDGGDASPHDGGDASPHDGGDVSPPDGGGAITIAVRVPGDISVPPAGSYRAVVSVVTPAGTNGKPAVVTIAPGEGAADSSSGPQVTFDVAPCTTAGSGPEIGAEVRIGFEARLAAQDPGAQEAGPGAQEAAPGSAASLDSLVSGGGPGGVA